MSVLAFVANAFGVLVIALPMPMSWMVLPRFSSSVFMVLGLFIYSFIYIFYCILGFGTCAEHARGVRSYV